MSRDENKQTNKKKTKEQKKKRKERHKSVLTPRAKTLAGEYALKAQRDGGAS